MKFRAHTVAILVGISLASNVIAFQAPLHVEPTGPVNLNLNISQLPIPITGEPYRFSLCLGLPLGKTASKPCRGRDAAKAKTVDGSAANSLLAFKPEVPLPRGFSLNGDGVLTVPAGTDVSTLNLKICAVQIGGSSSCQPVKFGKSGLQLNNRPIPQPAAAVPAGPGAAPAAAPVATKEIGGGGPGAGTAVTLGLLATAGIVGYVAKDQIANLFNGGEGGGCGPEPAFDFSACFSGQASSVSCTSNLAKLEAYCQTCNKKRGLNQFATTCVAK